MKLVGAREHDNRNPSVTQDRELVSFLEQTISSFRIRRLSVGLVLYPLDTNSDLPSGHYSFFFFFVVEIWERGQRDIIIRRK